MKTAFSCFFSLAALACSASSEPSAKAPGDSPDETTREALRFEAPCNATTCGAVPASVKSATPECTPSADTCTFHDPDPSASVSYRECAKTECGAEPDASICPSGTTFKGNTCGAENDAPCSWTTTCAPPRSTTPCPEANGCGEMPLIGIVCKDGSNGELTCMKVGARCAWQPSCE